ncbi:hypothetical protein ACHAWF_007312, partial [Thalassiosira exigua]
EVAFGGPRARSGGDGDGDGDEEEGDEARPESSTSPPKKKQKLAGNREEGGRGGERPTLTSHLLRSLRDVDRPTRPYVGPGRPNANDVDVAHPWIMAVHPPREVGDDAPLASNDVERGDGTDRAPAKEFLAIENGNRAVECLQLFVDALVESGRAGDSRLGVRFFREWVAAVAGRDGSAAEGEGSESKKRKQTEAVRADESLPLGALSLHNYSNGSVRTFRSMARANVGSCLGTLDVTGVHGLTDAILSRVVCAGSFPRLRRLSVKNCRKITGKGIASLARLTRLSALDVGGCFNVRPDEVVSLVRNHPSTKEGRLTELYASGLGWTDVALEELVDATAGSLRGLGVGFSPYVSGPGLILTLSKVASTLTRLAVPFCPGMDDAAAAALGKKLPKLAVLDVRGCGKVHSLSGMMEGRAAAAGDGAARRLFVLARYSGISNGSLEETTRLFNGESLTCIIDGGGIGGGIHR